MTVRNAIKILALFWLMISSVMCGGNGKSSQVTLTVNPTSPIVITGNYVNPISGQTISAPWFQFTVQVENDSDEELTIIGLSTYVTLTQQDGTPLTGTATLTPSSANYTMTCAAELTSSVTYASFGTIPAGSTQYLQLIPAETLPTGCPAAQATFNPAAFYVGGNPNPNSSGPPNPGQTFNYTVQISPQGWFGSLTSPDERFEKVVTFSTN